VEAAITVQLLCQESFQTVCGILSTCTAAKVLEHDKQRLATFATIDHQDLTQQMAAVVAAYAAVGGSNLACIVDPSTGEAAALDGS
jgi:hypothetical protein